MSRQPSSYRQSRVSFLTRQNCRALVARTFQYYVVCGAVRSALKRTTRLRLVRTFRNRSRAARTRESDETAEKVPEIWYRRIAVRRVRHARRRRFWNAPRSRVSTHFDRRPNGNSPDTKPGFSLMVSRDNVAVVRTARNAVAEAKRNRNRRSRPGIRVERILICDVEVVKRFTRFVGKRFGLCTTTTIRVARPSRSTGVRPTNKYTRFRNSSGIRRILLANTQHPGARRRTLRVD